MRRSRPDDNQTQVVKDLRKIGYSVLPVGQFALGFDLIVGRAGRNFLFELKDPDKFASQRKLTTAEKEFMKLWRGQIDVVTTVDEIISAITSAKPLDVESK